MGSPQHLREVRYSLSVCKPPSVTCSGQYIYMMAMLLIPLIPIFALVTQNVILLNDIIERKADLIESARSVENGDETGLTEGNLLSEVVILKSNS